MNGSIGQTTVGTPALAESGDFYLGWTGANANHNLNILHPQTGTQTVLTDTAPVGAGPSLAFFNNHLYVAWLSSGNDNTVYIGYYNGTPNLQNHTVIPGIQAASRPCIIDYNLRLYVTWQGLDGSLNLTSSPDGINFDAPVRLGGDILSAGPSMTVWSDTLYITYSVAEAPNPLVLVRYDPHSAFNVSHGVAFLDTGQVTSEPGIAAIEGGVMFAWNADGYVLSGYYYDAVQSPYAHTTQVALPVGPYGAAVDFGGDVYYTHFDPNANDQLIYKVSVPLPPVFSDDFTENQPNAWTPIAGQWQILQPVGSGQPYQYGEVNPNGGTSLAGYPYWVNYTVQATVVASHDTNGSGVGLLGRVQSVGPRFFELGLYNQSGSKILGLWNNYGPRTLMASVPFDYQVNTPYTLSLDLKGFTITGSLSDNVGERATVQGIDPGYGRGRRHYPNTGQIGVNSLQTAAQFTNVLVQENGYILYP